MLYILTSLLLSTDHSKSDIQLHTSMLLTTRREFISGLYLFESIQRDIALSETLSLFRSDPESFMRNQTKLVLVRVSVNSRLTAILFQVSNHLVYPRLRFVQIIFVNFFKLFFFLLINIAQQ